MEGHPTGFSRTAADLPPGMSGENARPPIGGGGEADSKGQGGGTSTMEQWALQKARMIYTQSTDYINMNVTNQWERNLRHFRNQHAPGSPYDRKDWKRSRTFRPKTRTNVKGSEASAAAAIFSTNELLDTQPRDPSNIDQVVCAQITKAIVEYRLDSSLYSWLLTVIGAYQDTKLYGICISHQYWKYRETVEVVPEFDDQGQPIYDKAEDGSDATDPETGLKVQLGHEERKVVEDTLCVDLIEPENFRFDPMCDWRNPAASSQYLQWLRPMSAGTAMEYMSEEGDDPRTGQPKWRKYELAQILGARNQLSDNRTRRAREGYDRTDPADLNSGNEFTTVWAHLNIVREKGVDLAWWTLGTELLLTDPIPLTKMFPHLRPGQRPFVVGTSTLEAHRNYPAGDAEQAAPVQEEINKIANQRLDNVMLVLNKRYHVRRGSQIDIDALMRNVSGGAVMMNEPEKDVVVVSTPDVTGSSYQEQDRLSTEFDELLGGFSQGSVLNAKNPSQTNGGMDRIATSAGAVQDWGIKLFFETWLGPVLKDIVRLEQMYESDETVIALAVKKSDLFKQFGIDHATDALLMQDLVVQVNVGLGNTDPMARLQRLVFGISNINGIPGMVKRLRGTAMADEILGALGFKDSTRFYVTEEEAAKLPPDPPPPEIAVKEKELEIRKADNDQRHAKEAAELDLKREIAYAELALKKDLTLEQLYTNLGIKKAEEKTKRDTAALNASLKIQEHNLKRTEQKDKPSPSKPPSKGAPPK
jgi:hypothetical protein